MIRTSVGLLGVALLWGWLVGLRIVPLRTGKLLWVCLGTLLVGLVMSSLVPHRSEDSRLWIGLFALSAASCSLHLLFLSLLRARRLRFHHDG